jgi:hypothetical protein
MKKVSEVAFKQQPPTESCASTKHNMYITHCLASEVPQAGLEGFSQFCKIFKPETCGNLYISLLD